MLSIRRISSSFHAVAAVAAFSATAAAQASYTEITDGTADSISADGTTVVGLGFSFPYSWTEAGGIVELVGTNDATGVSADGSIILGQGDSPSQARRFEAGVWTSLGGLGVDGCPDISNSYDISDDGGVAVGLGWDTCDATAFKWTQADGMVGLSEIGPTTSRANVVSGDGTRIGGWDQAANGTRRASLWNADGTQELILDGVTLDGAGEAWGMSTDGTWVCGSGSPNGFVYSDATGALDLGPLAGAPPGIQGQMNAISDDGKTAVGFYGSFFDGNDAVIWTEAGGLKKLSDVLTAAGVTIPAGSRLVDVTGMTPDGRTIVGSAEVGFFQFKAFIATLPEAGPDCGFTIFGENAAPANVIQLTASGGNQPGTMFTLTNASAPGNMTTTVVALEQLSLPTLNGLVLVNPLEIINPTLSAPIVGGTSTVDISIPNDAVLVGLDVYMQTLSREPSFMSGLAFSNGIRLVVCP